MRLAIYSKLTITGVVHPAADVGQMGPPADISQVVFSVVAQCVSDLLGWSVLVCGHYQDAWATQHMRSAWCIYNVYIVTTFPVQRGS